MASVLLDVCVFVRCECMHVRLLVLLDTLCTLKRDCADVVSTF
jgi:hypothetical protein